MAEESNSSTSGLQGAVRYAIVFLFLFAGLNHFLRADLFEHAMPPWIPAQHELVLFTGVCEIAGAIGLAVSRLRKAATVALVVFLLAVFPVNMHMAFHPELFPAIPQVLLWIRLPLQFALIWAVIWSA